MERAKSGSTGGFWKKVWYFFKGKKSFDISKVKMTKALPTSSSSFGHFEAKKNAPATPTPTIEPYDEK